MLKHVHIKVAHVVVNKHIEQCYLIGKILDTYTYIIAAGYEDTQTSLYRNRNS